MMNETDTEKPAVFQNEGAVAHPPAKLTLPTLTPKAQEVKNPIDELAAAAQRISQIQPPPPKPSARVHQRPTKAFD